MLSPYTRMNHGNPLREGVERRVVHEPLQCEEVPRRGAVPRRG